MARRQAGWKSRGRRFAEMMKEDGMLKAEVMPTEVTKDTELDIYAKKDFSNVGSLPADVVAQLKGDDGANGAVGATFSKSGTTLYITT